MTKSLAYRQAGGPDRGRDMQASSKHQINSTETIFLDFFSFI
jgi:hypothetical protein